MPDGDLYTDNAHWGFYTTHAHRGFYTSNAHWGLIPDSYNEYINGTTCLHKIYRDTNCIKRLARTNHW